MAETNTLTLTSTISSGESLSDSADLSAFALNKDSYRLFGIDLPATWTTANLVVYQKHADGAYKAVKDETGSDLTITATAGDCIRFSNPAQFAALTDIKLLSGSTATPVNQAADREITLILRAI